MVNLSYKSSVERSLSQGQAFTVSKKSACHCLGVGSRKTCSVRQTAVLYLPTHSAVLCPSVRALRSTNVVFVSFSPEFPCSSLLSAHRVPHSTPCQARDSHSAPCHTSRQHCKQERHHRGRARGLGDPALSGRTSLKKRHLS